MEIRFFIPMQIPTATAQTHRISAGKGRKAAVYDSPALRDAREKFTAHLAQHRPMKPMTGALQLTTQWYFPIKGKHIPGDYKITRPDTDNLVKLFKDCMTKTGYWIDDAQVAVEITEKRYSDIPGILVHVTQLPAGDRL